MRRVGLFACLLVVFGGLLDGQQEGDWPAYGRDAGGERFSPLDAIRRENVASLEVAWTFRTGDAYQPKDGRPTAFEATPLHVDGTLYLSTPVGRVIALDPVTGQQRWAFDAKVPRDKGYGDFASRGVVRRWQRGGRRSERASSSPPSTRVSSRSTQRPVSRFPGFGERGTVDLRQGLRIAPRGFADYQVTSPPAVVGDTIVVGSAIQDNARTTEPSGEVRGFDAMTGKTEVELGSDPAGSVGGRRGYMEERQRRPHRGRQCLVGDRRRSRAQSRLRADRQPEPRLLRRRAPRRQPLRQLRRRAARRHRRACLALPDGPSRSLGLRRRVAADPVRLAAKTAGRSPRSAVASKTGHLFVLDRETGTPLIPVEERAVPKSDVPARNASPTQPFPTAPRSLARTSLNGGGCLGADRRGSRVVSRRR